MIIKKITMRHKKLTFGAVADSLMPTLHLILAHRLRYNRTWNNVKVVTGKRNMKIIWFEAKNPTDHSKTRDVKPFNIRTLTHQIAVQFEKLEKDRKDQAK